MNEEHYNIDHGVITSYLAGEANAEETAIVEQWVAESEENRQVFNQLKTVWMESSSASKGIHFDVDQAWKKVDARTEGSKGKVIAFPGYLMRIAAIFLVGILVYFIYQSTSDTEMTRLMADEQIEIDTLIDGSVITLNQQSSIAYNDDFNGDERKVELKGEAFFKVAPDKAKPFIISTEKLNVQVLGTAFFVKAYDSLTLVEVGVEEGKVQVTTEKETIILLAGDYIYYDKQTNGLRKSDFKPNDFHWKTNAMSFKDATLEEVFNDLSAIYGVDIKVADQAILDCMLTGKFPVTNAKETLELLQNTFNFSFTQEVNKYTIAGKGCE